MLESEEIGSLLDSFLKRHRNITRLRLSNHEGELFSDIDDYLYGFPRLQELEISGEPYSDLEFEQDISRLPKNIGTHPIKSLRLNYPAGLRETFALDNLEFLEITTQQAYEILECAMSYSTVVRFPHLLTLRGEFQISPGRGMDCKIIFDTPNLESLTLLREMNGLSFTKGSLKKLKCLHLNETHSVAGLEDILTLSTNLEEFWACDVGWDEGVNQLVLEQFSKMPNLQVVKLNYLNRVGDEFIDALDLAAPKMHTLDISATCVTALFLKRLVRNRMSTSSKSRILSLTVDDSVEDVGNLKENVTLHMSVTR